MTVLLLPNLASLGSSFPTRGLGLTLVCWELEVGRSMYPWGTVLRDGETGRPYLWGKPNPGLGNPWKPDQGMLGRETEREKYEKEWIRSLGLQWHWVAYTRIYYLTVLKVGRIGFFWRPWGRKVPSLCLSFWYHQILLGESAGDLGSIPRSGRSPGEGKGYPLCILAWRIPWTV